MNKLKKNKFGDVDLTKPHFGIYYGNNSSNDIYELIMVLSVAQTVDEMRLCLLVHDITYEQVIKEVQNEISYYLFGLKNPDPIGYLIYHCQTLANAYSNVRFSFVQKIHKNNILYYFNARPKQLNIYNDSFTTAFQRRYFELSVDQIYELAIGRDIQGRAANYNKDLYDIYEIIFFKLIQIDNLEIIETPTIVEFSKWLSKLKVLDFCNILNYLNKVKLVNFADVERLLKLYHLNARLHCGTWISI